MEAAQLSSLYCIAFILHIYYIIIFLFFQRIIHALPFYYGERDGTRTHGGHLSRD